MSKNPKKPLREFPENVADHWRGMLRRAETPARCAEVIIAAISAGVPIWEIEETIDCLENVRARSHARLQNLTAAAWRRLADCTGGVTAGPQVRR